MENIIFYTDRYLGVEHFKDSQNVYLRKINAKNTNIDNFINENIISR